MRTINIFAQDKVIFPGGVRGQFSPAVVLPTEHDCCILIPNGDPEQITNVGACHGVFARYVIVEGALNSAECKRKIALHAVKRVRIQNFSAEGISDCDTSDMPELDKAGNWKESLALVDNLLEHFLQSNSDRVDMLDVVRDAYFPDIDAQIWLICDTLPLSIEEQQSILAASTVVQAVSLIKVALTRLLENRIAYKAIEEQVQRKIAGQQKRALLLEQRRTIDGLLGDNTDADQYAYIEGLIQRVNPSLHARERVERELAQLKRLPAFSQEAAMSQTYIDWLLSLPWGKYVPVEYALSDVEKRLQDSHFGLARVKRSLLELAALEQSKIGSPRLRSVICFLGPPGTGKTSLVKSFADAIKRPFISIAVGGVSDEAVLRGQRKGYVGARPGRIIEAVRQCGTSNPVILFDEIDKMGDFNRSTAAAALLDVLDPEQMNSFQDNYLDVRWDLASCLFFATANDHTKIPWALRDRLEIIEVPAYSPEDKLRIAQDYLLPRLLRECRLAVHELIIPQEVLEDIIGRYAIEAGVRELDRVLLRIVRSHVFDQNSGRVIRSDSPHIVSVEEAESVLGYSAVKPNFGLQTGTKGFCNAVMQIYGTADLYRIDVRDHPGSTGCHLVGNASSVMRESAEVAWNWFLDSGWQLAKMPSAPFGSQFVFSVAPLAVPKDGTSAGLPFALALMSLFSDGPSYKPFAATGEVGLSGIVLPVGGVVQKALAVHRLGVRRLVIPKNNLRDLELLPKEVRQSLKVCAAENVSEAVAWIVSDE